MITLSRCLPIKRKSFSGSPLNVIHCTLLWTESPVSGQDVCMDCLLDTASCPNLIYISLFSLTYTESLCWTSNCIRSFYSYLRSTLFWGSSFHIRFTKYCTEKTIRTILYTRTRHTHYSIQLNLIHYKNLFMTEKMFTTDFLKKSKKLKTNEDLEKLKKTNKCSYNLKDYKNYRIIYNIVTSTVLYLIEMWRISKRVLKNL